jgi:hypothetical protein
LFFLFFSPLHLYFCLCFSGRRCPSWRLSFRFKREGLQRQQEAARRRQRRAHLGRALAAAVPFGLRPGGASEGVAGEAMTALRNRALAAARSTLLSSIQADLERKR